MRKSVEKRCKHVSNMFVSLSSGYDSGLICGILNQLHINYDTIILNNHRENMGTIEQRMLLNSTNMNLMITWDNTNTKNIYKNHLLINAEENVGTGSDCIASSYIMDTAHKYKYRVHISGHGVDEIISDYYGGKFSSNFKGKFPANLNKIFPTDASDTTSKWQNFYNGLMKGNLNREEVIGGLYSIETRFPFLDKNVVQEFLWLHESLKNRYYKAPLKMYLDKLLYPYDQGKKIGFSC